MKTSRRLSDRPASLASARLLSRANRRVWTRDLIWFHIEELNGLFDGLQGRPAVGRLDMARSRARRVLVAATWNPEAYREHAWTFVMEGLERPEDAFGPALLLLVTDQAPSSEAGRWLRDLPSAVVGTIEMLGILKAANP